MLQTLTNYIAGVLLVLSITFGYTAYSVHTDKVVAEGRVIALTKEVNAANLATQKVTDSCKSAQETLERVSKLNSTLQEGLQRHLTGLEALPATTLQDTNIHASKTNTEASSRYADDDQLSGPLMQLLDSAYCDSNRDDSSCTAP